MYLMHLGHLPTFMRFFICFNENLTPRVVVTMFQRCPRYATAKVFFTELSGRRLLIHV